MKPYNDTKLNDGTNAPAYSPIRHASTLIQQIASQRNQIPKSVCNQSFYTVYEIKINKTSWCRRPIPHLGAR